MFLKFLFIYFILTILLCICYADRKSDNRLKDLKAVEKLQPLVDGPNVFFWRPQKVGSSTLLSILMSYGYRYNYLPKRKSSSNSYCRLLAKCAIATKSYPHNISYSYLEDYVTSKIPGTPMKGQYLTTRDLEAERLSNSVGFKISLSHEICNLNAQVIQQNIVCSFNKLSKVVQQNTKLNPVKELFMLREPLSRAISVYYFWGELYKMKHGMKTNRNSQHRNLAWEGELKLGQIDLSKPVIITGQKFKYHGLENTPPPYDIAMYYANHSVYRTGMPGPSYTWSAYADNLYDALEIVKSDRICTIVLERLAESLVVAAHFLNWSLADVVVTKHRKALSSHPKHTAWPKPAINMLVSQFNAPENGEYAMYNASLWKLNDRIERLTRQGVDVPAEVRKLNMLQKRVTEICLNDEYLLHYRDFIHSSGLPPHPSHNKLREVEEKYVENDHMFSFNREILLSYDICGPCEAHAILLSIDLGLSDSIENAITLQYLDPKYIQNNVNFAKCPVFTKN